MGGETRTVLHEAARSRDAVLARKVIAAGARVDQQDDKVGLSALHLAARAKSHELVSILVETRADTAQVSRTGKTAAELAETNGIGSATLTLLRAEPIETPGKEAEVQQKGFEDLTPEQRALLFLD